MVGFFSKMTKLQKKRKALKLTQERVALLAGITARTLTSHETGKGRRMPYPAQQALARVLDASVNYLFDENGRAR